MMLVMRLYIDGTATINGGKFESAGLGVTVNGRDGSTTIITGGEFIQNDGGNVIQNKGTLEMSGGTVNGKSSNDRGVVGIANLDGGTATIENVTVTTEGTYDNETLGDKGLRNDSGGIMTVKNCNVDSTFKSVLNANSSAITISGGTFQGQYGIHNENGTFELSGSPTISGGTADIYLSDDQKITVTGTLGNAAPYSVLTADTPTEGSPVEITDSSNTSLNDTTKFKAADSNYAVRKNSDGQLELAASEHTHDDIIFEPWTSTTSLPRDAGNYYLTTDVTLSWWWEPSANITLCLNGHTITRSSSNSDSNAAISVSTNRVLNIYDCQGKGAVTTSDRNCIYIAGFGTANIYGGTFNSDTHPAIAVVGTVTIENASVYGPQVVKIEEYGMGTINGGTFESTDNPTIYVEANASLEITGGTFIRNTGGNIIQNLGKLEMSGGTVTGRSSSSNGAVGIVNYGGKATIKNVTVTTEGTATDGDTLADKGLRNDNRGTMIVEDCNINSTNRAVWNTGGATIKISGGTFNGRYGMYNNNGNFELSGSPTFTGSTADIYLSNNQKITVTGNLGNVAPYSVLTATAPTVGNPVAITNSGDTSYNNASKFTSADGNTVRKNIDGQLELAVSATYTITYDKGTGSDITGSVPSGTKTEGVDFTLSSETFSRTGYTQTGWSTSDGGAKEYDLGGTYSTDGNITLYPCWTANTYTVTYYIDGTPYSVDDAFRTYTYNQSLALPTPTKTGYTFDGWYVDSYGNGNKVSTLDANTYTSAISLYAKWNAIGYTITYNKNGGTIENESNYTSYTSGDSFSLPMPTKTGYTFGGWYAESDFSGSAVTAISAADTGNKTYYAKWEIITYNITYELDGGTVTGNPDTYTVLSDSITLNAPSKAGHTFIGWSGTDINGTSMTVVISTGSTGNRKYTANWSVDTYTVTYNKDNGTIANESNYTKYEYGKGLTLPTPTKTGYTFGGWYAESDFSGSAVTAISATDTGNKTYYAKWTVLEGKVILNYQDGRANGTLDVEYGGTYDLPTPERTGYMFDGWFTEPSGGSEVTNGSTVTTTESHTLYAHWTANQYTVTFDYQGATSDNSKTSQTVTYDSTYGELPTPKKTGFSFGGWYTQQNGQGTQITANTTVSITDAQTLYAYWITDSTGGDDNGGDNNGGDNSGDDNTGGDNTGDDNNGGDNTGGGNNGGDNTGGGNNGGDTSQPSTGTTTPSTGDSTPPSNGNDAGNVTVNSKSGKNAPGVTISGETSTKLKEEIIAEHLTPEEKAAVANGDNLDVILVVEAEYTVPAEDKQVTEAVLTNTEYNIGMYLNIDLIKLINGQQVGKITGLNSPINVTIEIPENLRNENRAFAIVRVHDGVAEILKDIDDDPDTITIATDKFSTYSIVYQDTEVSNSGNPNTGVTIPITVVAVALAITAAAVNVKKKLI